MKIHNENTINWFQLMFTGRYDKLNIISFIESG